MSVQPFHIAIPVPALEPSRTFYRETIGCSEGRSSDHWVDFNFFGHQLVIHIDENHKAATLPTNAVDGKQVPVPHYGVVLQWDEFHAFAKDLQTKGVEFVIEPYVRFEGKPGEQSTMFFYDPAGNALEFKAFKDINQLFTR